MRGAKSSMLSRNFAPASLEGLHYCRPPPVICSPVRMEIRTTSKRCRFDVERHLHIDFRTIFESKATCRTTGAAHRCRIDIVSMSPLRTGKGSLLTESCCCHQEQCREQLRAVRAVLPGCAVLCSRCHAVSPRCF